MCGSMRSTNNGDPTHPGPEMSDSSLRESKLKRDAVGIASTCAPSNQFKGTVYQKI